MHGLFMLHVNNQQFGIEHSQQQQSATCSSYSSFAVYGSGSFAYITRTCFVMSAITAAATATVGMTASSQPWVQTNCSTAQATAV